MTRNLRTKIERVRRTNTVVFVRHANSLCKATALQREYLLEMIDDMLLGMTDTLSF